MAAWLWAAPEYSGWCCEQCDRSDSVWDMRGRCQPTAEGFHASLCVAPRCSAGETARCPIAEVIGAKPLLERIFSEYQAVKRLGIRVDEGVDVVYLTTLDIELQAIESADFERRQKLERMKHAAQGRDHHQRQPPRAL